MILEHDSSSHKPIPQAPIRSRNRMGAIFVRTAFTKKSDDKPPPPVVY